MRSRDRERTIDPGLDDRMREEPDRESGAFFEEDFDWDSERRTEQAIGNLEVIRSLISDKARSMGSRFGGVFKKEFDVVAEDVRGIAQDVKDTYRSIEAKLETLVQAVDERRIKLERMRRGEAIDIEVVSEEPASVVEAPNPGPERLDEDPDSYLYLYSQYEAHIAQMNEIAERHGFPKVRLETDLPRPKERKLNRAQRSRRNR